MVSPEKIQAVLGMEGLEELKEGPVVVFNPFKVFIFPQFIPVPEFDVGVILVFVVSEGHKEEQLVVGKIVGMPTVAAVTVAEKDDFGVLIDRKDWGLVDELLESFEEFFMQFLG